VNRKACCRSPPTTQALRPASAVIVRWFSLYEWRDGLTTEATLVSVIYFLLPLAGVLVVAAVIAFWLAARSGQFDDLDTPPLRILFDDEEKP
jgi:cbb3-type cytochrome oxidase maturation protein